MGAVYLRSDWERINKEHISRLTTFEKHVLCTTWMFVCDKLTSPNCSVKLAVQAGHCRAYLWLPCQDLSLTNFNLQYMIFLCSGFANKPDFKLISTKTFLEKSRLILTRRQSENIIPSLTTDRLIYFDDDLICSLPTVPASVLWHLTGQRKGDSRVLFWAPVLTSMYVC